MTGAESTTPTISSWRRETDEGEFYALSRRFALPTGKKVLSVCNLQAKRCTLPTMPKNRADFSREIAKISVFKADLDEKDE